METKTILTDLESVKNGISSDEPWSMEEFENGECWNHIKKSL